jgi:hypothetical protein
MSPHTKRSQHGPAFVSYEMTFSRLLAPPQSAMTAWLLWMLPTGNHAVAPDSGRGVQHISVVAILKTCTDCCNYSLSQGARLCSSPYCWVILTENPFRNGSTIPYTLHLAYLPRAVHEVTGCAMYHGPSFYVLYVKVQDCVVALTVG